MNINRVKLFALTFFAVPVFALAVFKANPPTVAAKPLNENIKVENAFLQDDVAAQYKKTCAVCHKATAEKWFDPAKMDEVLIEIVLKGKKAEKPPHMPGYAEKGMTEEQAKLLVAYMRQMRTPPPSDK
jgi:mono/diheme cytochrome c family protein